MNIPLVNLSRQNKKYIKTLMAHVKQTLIRADFVSGEAVYKFEKAFAKYCDKPYAVSVNSGTDALFFALLSYGISTGDEVITAPNSFFATVEAIEATGAKAVFADVDPVSFTLDPQKAQKHITSRTRVIIPVHLYGQPADMDSFVKLQHKYKRITILEDCCQAHGALYKKKSLPVTETGAFSFYPGKNLGAFGDGGALITQYRKVADSVRSLANHGSIQKYIHNQFGYNSRLDTLQAQILLLKLAHLTTWNKLRRAHAKTYTKLLAKISGVTIPQELPDRTHVYHQYVIQTFKRNTLQNHLKQKGITTLVHYPLPLHLQRPFKKRGYKNGDYPICEALARKILSLPMFPELTSTEIAFIVSEIARVIQ